MCLITNKEPQIATEDIQVVKILTEDLRSVYYSFQYEFGVEVSSEIEPSKHPFPFSGVERDYLSRMFGNWHTELHKNGLRAYGSGLHSMSFEYYNEYYVPDNFKIAYLAIIPKGATYIQDFHGLYVSDKLKVIEAL